MRSVTLLLSLLTLMAVSRPALTAPRQPPAALAERYLHSGQYSQGEKDLAADLAKQPTNDQARFGLGVIQFVQGFERLAQGLYKYGLKDTQRTVGNLIPVLRLPLPENPKPEALTHEIARKLVQTWVDDLNKSEGTLAAIKDEGVKLPLRVGAAKLDLDGDGTPDGTLFDILGRIGILGSMRDREFLIHFDRGDVSWLRGYCHLLAAMGEFVLAHDGQELFDCTAHLFFTRPSSPHPHLQTGKRVFQLGGDVDIADLIAFVHLIRMPVKEPARMKASLRHLEQMMVMSRESWKYILAETDDDREWLPNPKQAGVLNVRVTDEMVKGWLDFIEEADALLAGKRLIPFWRGDGDRGINLRRVFTEPRPFDLVLWIQGTAATPYLEKGQMTRPEVWTQLQRLFGGDFIGFAIWFN